MDTSGPIIICGLDTTPEHRGDCPDALHDYPLPEGYVSAHETAMRRLRKGWTQRRCPACRLYGWIPGRPLNDGTDGPVLHGTSDGAR